MMLIPIAVATKSRPLMSFGFFMAPLGALMALLSPAVGFDGYSIWLPRMLGFYGTHFMIIIEGLAAYAAANLVLNCKDVARVKMRQGA
jgi:uncharacterized membrane protein YwaF